MHISAELRQLFGRAKRVVVLTGAEIAKVAGAYLVEVNPERTPLSSLCDEVLTGKAGEVLPLIQA